jgi:hypothetical protein
MTISEFLTGFVAVVYSLVYMNMVFDAEASRSL